jgi:hypothetical protein
MELRSGERSAVFEVVYDRQADKILYKKLL